ncbi:hypothetical protein LOTGIDRAFT_156652 [Lottia gigantea]|uniref:FAM86 N-terminal domain-containing protein n=1 Tax=Lottia gigantea TaxID=225164 RepID=V4AIU6_LOTGI|nr:hypothetical protein LOTGIDRAFT_156652 [Lottia gigantea]ESP04044.1 hypothetical protein LOTGIDRAFT_156652 [Lottia gigantea]
MAASMKKDVSASNSFHPEELLRNLSAQFLEMVPVRKIKWEEEQASALVTSQEIQRNVLRATVQHPICLIYPPSLSYRRYFMKTLIHKLEEYQADICDEIYEVYTDLLQQSEEEDDTLCYKTYSLPDGGEVSLQESVNLVCQGTTGLSTWQAAQHLTEFVLENKERFENRNILELGSGLGLTGIVTCIKCHVNSYTFSDCHPQVLYLLAKNIEANLTQQIPRFQEGSDRDKKIIRKIRRQLSINAESYAELVGNEESMIMSPTQSQTLPDQNDEDEIQSDPNDLELNNKYWILDKNGLHGTYKKDDKVRIAKLDWENVDNDLMLKLKPDVILAADVIYDSTINPSLVAVLQMLLKPHPDTGQIPIVYLASTVRNEDTRDSFLILLGSEGLVYTIVEPPKLSLFYYDRSVPIEILQISTQ